MEPAVSPSIYGAHLLDLGHLSWGIDDEHVYTCPCGRWQLHVPQNMAYAMMDPAPKPGGVPDFMPWLMTGIRALNAAMEDALWEHETACLLLQHAAYQAGVVRREPFHMYLWTPEEYAATQALPTRDE